MVSKMCFIVFYVIISRIKIRGVTRIHGRTTRAFVYYYCHLEHPANACGNKTTFLKKEKYQRAWCALGPPVIVRFD